VPKKRTKNGGKKKDVNGRRRLPRGDGGSLAYLTRESLIRIGKTGRGNTTPRRGVLWAKGVTSVNKTATGREKRPEKNIRMGAKKTKLRKKKKTLPNT